jgi:DNA-binding MarR family transcriptional regulator
MLTKYSSSIFDVKNNVSNAKLCGMVRSATPDCTEVADRLHSAAIHLLRHAAQPDVLSGQGPARLSALSVLVFGGQKTLGQLAAAERVKPPTMSRIVAGLKRGGLAKIHKDGKDARRILIRVTPKGERVLQAARRRRIEALSKVLAALDLEEVGCLRRAAEIMERALRRTL